MPDLLNLLVASAEVALALLVFRHRRGFGRALPWLAALMAFFLLRAANRFFVVFFGEEPLALSAVVDGLAVILLILLFFGVRKMIRGLRSVEEEAIDREAEYERALVEYRRLMRHRIANPLAAVRGGIQSLRELPDLTLEDRMRLLDSIQLAADRLEHVALTPTPVSSEERFLDARPSGS